MGDAWSKLNVMAPGGAGATMEDNGPPSGGATAGRRAAGMKKNDGRSAGVEGNAVARQLLPCAANGPLGTAINPFAHSLRASLDALAASDPSAAREAQGGYRHGVSGGRAVECDHTALP